jgi:uncharacterized protein YbaR (Trm112 family)
VNKQLQLNPLLKELLCCPACKENSSLQHLDNSDKLVCDQCSREYPLKEVAGEKGEGMLIPSLLIED